MHCHTITSPVLQVSSREASRSAGCQPTRIPGTHPPGRPEPLHHSVGQKAGMCGPLVQGARQGGRGGGGGRPKDMAKHDRCKWSLRASGLYCGYCRERSIHHALHYPGTTCQAMSNLHTGSAFSSSGETQTANRATAMNQLSKQSPNVYATVRARCVLVVDRCVTDRMNRGIQGKTFGGRHGWA